MTEINWNLIDTIKESRGLELAGYIVLIIGIIIMYPFYLPSSIGNIVLGDCNKVCLPIFEAFLFSGGALVILGLILMAIGHIKAGKPTYNFFRVLRYGWCEKSLIKSQQKRR